MLLPLSTWPEVDAYPTRSRARFPEGCAGSGPSLAAPEAGRRLVEAASADGSADSRPCPAEP